MSGLYRLCERAFSRLPRGRMGFVIYRYFSAGSKAVRINSVFFFCIFVRKMSFFEEMFTNIGFHKLPQEFEFVVFFFRFIVCIFEHIRK